MYKRQPLYGNIQFIGIAENVFNRLLVFVPVFEDDFDCMVFVKQNAVNKEMCIRDRREVGLRTGVAVRHKIADDKQSGIAVLVVGKKL